MAFAPFVPLRVLSAFSMLEGAIEPKAIAKLATERGFPAIAMCDRNGLYGSVPFAQACIENGVQPIVGALLGVARPDSDQIDHLPLYVQDDAGWLNLCRLVSAAHLERPLEQVPHVPLAALEGYTDGLIALTGASEGAVTRLLAQGQGVHAARYLDRLEALFPQRLYIELARRGEPTEVAAEEALLDLAYARDLPLVATNPANFAEPHFYKAHDAMLCIANSRKLWEEDRPRSAKAAYVKSAPMMQELFADLPEALANTLTIAQRCAFAPPQRAPILPSLAGDLEGEAKMLAEDARRGLDARLAIYEDLSDEERQTYYERLDYEVGIIHNMGFPGYFLIVADFIKWAKDHNIPVGPGRGSGAGSLVAWSLTITDLDPIRLGLLFERFLNPERVSMPDFDIDFCETRRGEVIRYVQEKYGADKVAQIITFGKMKARAVLRDCGRILDMSYGQVDRLCKMVPNHPTDPWSLPRALNGAAEFKGEYDNDNEVRTLVDLAMQLEGLPRNSSTHAAGVVIGDRPLAELVPLYRDPRSDMPVTQFDMKVVEGAGLVKFDFLGLKTLSVLQKAVDLLKRRGIECDLGTVWWDDKAVYDLMQRGDTVGVFQLESEGMRRTLTAVKPTKFEDIIALVSLYRPGPMDNIPLFGKRKAGVEPIEYPHAKLEGILKETYGIFVYQEQVMQAAQILAGYSLGDADLLRRAMGKKNQAEMDKQRQRFIDGCKKVSDIEANEASALFDLIDKFAGYGFNKSHAAAYALLAYQTAWLKAHYPEEFYAAAMCFDMDQSEKLAVFVDDARRNGIEVAAPDLNRSEAEFSVERTDDGYAVRYGLAGLRNVGEKAMDAIVAEREAHGWFESLDDFFSRLPKGAMNSRQLEALIAAGAFDHLEPNRGQLTANVDLLLAVADAAIRERSSGQEGLFGNEDSANQGLRMKDAEDWSRAERMAKERETFGFYFSAHPIEQFRDVASANGARSYSSLMTGGPAGEARGRAVIAAMVEGAKRGQTRRGKDFIRADFSDSTGQFSAACFEEGLVPQFTKWAQESTCVLLTVELDSPSPDEPPRVTIRGARPLAEVAGGQRMLLTLEVSSEAALGELALSLQPGPPGHGEVQIALDLGQGERPVMRLGHDYKVDGKLADALERIEGISNITLVPKTGPKLHRAA
ncbi:DNA polymerase III subunit alpha [Citromicrobium sp. JL31]|uniref:DNA polymerase III subunit alpha n=1 Tax=unclassified Citromicrobium TaxID=2630544 RepID=UPI0006C93AC3|nr:MULTISPECIES: DNA polymerase III subunit alpha [unclassified Citromicrobium]KPM12265.1 DNA polymerase III subunit alpha [Citromicrobium sp. JL1351]KPM13041.1 DNA polymerase III subunit alpha [Citromicrobium sp. JL31]KPM20753.1 DNA polymerase III subunit alpha [Citromicrobium sp. JL2201]